MEIIIERVTTKDDEVAMLRIRQQVFHGEMGLAIPRLTIRDNSGSFHLLARVGPHGDAVAALSVVDTSGDHGLHEGYGLKFPRRLGSLTTHSSLCSAAIAASISR